MNSKHENYKSFTSQELWEKWIIGDSFAAEVLFNRHGLKAIFWCRKQFGISKEECSDLVQETFVKILEAQQIKNTEIREFENYLYQALRLNFYNRNRTATNRAEKKQHLTSVSSYDNHKQFESDDFENELLQNLNERQRVCFELSTKGFSYEEIAQQTNQNINQVRGQLERAKKKLRLILKFRNK